jgi:hypothetical protein
MQKYERLIDGAANETQENKIPSHERWTALIHASS